MISVKLVSAIAIASEAHKNQKDKGGLPYILHPIAVMNMVEKYDENTMIVAVLHDVIEDAPEFQNAIYNLNLSEEQLNALQDLTHDLYEPYQEYINNLLANGNKLAIRVKCADITHNMSRLKHLDVKTRERLIKKYTPALERITVWLKNYDIPDLTTGS